MPPSDRREVVLVEGLIDVHHLRAKGFRTVAAIGGSRVQPAAVAGLRRLGFESVVLALDNDTPGRKGIVGAIDLITRSEDAPAVRVLEPALLADSKDPDAFVQTHGSAPFRALIDEAECAISWRARDLITGVTPQDDAMERRAALRRVGDWLGALPARYALEQEDAVRHVADQCGYSRAAVERAFRARFWDRSETRGGTRLSIER
jgi:DNA primase